MSSKKADRIERKKRKISAFLKLVEEDDSKKAKLDEDDFQALKSKLRERKKLLQKFPRFDLKASGHDASVDVLESQRKPLFFHDLQDLLSFALIGDRSSYKPYSWCKLDKWNKISGMTVVVFDGLGLKDYVEHRETLFRRWEPLFPFKLHFIQPSSSLPREFALLTLSTGLKNNILSGNLIKEALKSKALLHFPLVSEADKNLGPSSSSPHSKVSRTSLLLNPRQMIQCAYPLPIPGFYEDKYRAYVPTFKVYKSVRTDSPLFCIDCEMCMTTARKLELTKICIVDEKLEAVYDSFVKPHNRITNYLTQYSGVTAKMLEPITTRLSDVQRNIQKLITPDSILVGHSLNSDMDALQMMHPYVIDTSQIYNLSGERHRRSKLALLSKLFLNKEIQNAGANGHCPMEDAVSTMELVLLKLKNGLTFGDNVFRDGVVSKSVEKSELLSDYKASFFSTVLKGKELRVIGNGESLHEYETLLPDPNALIQCKETDEIYKAACESAEKNDLTICHVPFVDQELNEEGSKMLWKVTKRIWKSLPVNGLLFMVWPGGRTERDDAFVGIRMKDDPQKKEIMRDKHAESL
eukprot:TRINITY_DN10758_c0_g1_i1.p1 TRINITY_DN10758_c0_g1~~TRINITY_DN10758_c0_g1_i1.p1  ORF type:complete len:595 (+),score=185.30 TRINITY_DN10758_c0_g1_i1:51-1787(+)